MLAASESSSCKCAINLDGGYFGTERPVGKPILRIESGALDAELAADPSPKDIDEIQEIKAHWERFSALNPEHSELILMPDATHMDFTMIPLLDHKLGFIPDITRYQTVCDRTNTAISDFFDSNLKAATE